jgi:hypothetical protein
MKITRPFFHLVLCIIAGFASCRSPQIAHIQPDSPRSVPAPLGFYTLVTDLGYHYLTISLEGAGDYQVTSELIGFNKFTRTQRGRWTWNPRRQEFLLTPNTASESLGFEFRRLRVDEQNPDTLQWLPLNKSTEQSGTSEPIRFRRENG